MEKLYSSNTLLKIEIGWWVGGGRGCSLHPTPAPGSATDNLDLFFSRIGKVCSCDKVSIPNQIMKIIFG